MEKLLKYTNNKDTLKKILSYVTEYDEIILDLGDLEINPHFLIYLLKLFRITASNNVGLIFLSESSIDSNLKRYFKVYKNYEEYKKLGIFSTYHIKMYMNDEHQREILKDVFVKNGFLTKIRTELNFLNKEHDSRTKDVYIIDFDTYKKSKLIEINKIKEKNKDTVVILLIDKQSTQYALRTVELGVDAIIEKPLDIISFVETVKKIVEQSNLKYENNQLNDRVMELYTELETELKIAKEVQRSLLPNDHTVFGEYNIKYIFNPSQGIGGDFCDIISIDENNFAVVFADISGHGIPAALLSSMLKVFIREDIKKYTSPAKFVELINEKIIKIFPKGKFVSLFCLSINIKTNIMRYCKASQEPALFLKNDKIYELETEGQVLGVFSKELFPELVIFEEKSIEFSYHDVLLLYTDGITEAINENNEYFGIERLKEKFKEHKHNIDEIRKLASYHISDDETLLTIWRENGEKR